MDIDMSVTIGLPQVIYLLLFASGFYQTPNKDWMSFVAAFLTLGLLYWGGFFG